MTRRTAFLVEMKTVSTRGPIAVMYLSRMASPSSSLSPVLNVGVSDTVVRVALKRSGQNRMPGPRMHQNPATVQHAEPLGHLDHGPGHQSARVSTKVDEVPGVVSSGQNSRVKACSPLALNA